jgi:UDP-glucose 4-epimerase
MKRILVTGGAGFIGSHLIDYLMQDGNSVVCIDDLSLGRLENIQHHTSSPHFKFIKLDILNKEEFVRMVRENEFDCVFHMAANSDIQMGTKYMNVDLQRTFLTTYNVLEAMKNHSVKNIIFASSSAVYGELNKQLSENSGPLFPISFYGAAKLASEAYISASCGNNNMKAWIIRFPNVVGDRATHGVVFDFINKLKKNPQKLVILGDGRQKKPYVYVRDLVEAMLFAWNNSNDTLNCFNVSVDSTTTVTRIAEIVVEEMELRDVKFIYTGGSRGWVGDVPRFQYDISKITTLGWKAKRSSDEAIRTAVRAELGKEV